MRTITLRRAGAVTGAVLASALTAGATAQAATAAPADSGGKEQSRTQEHQQGGQQGKKPKPAQQLGEVESVGAKTVKGHQVTVLKVKGTPDHKPGKAPGKPGEKPDKAAHTADKVLDKAGKDAHKAGEKPDHKPEPHEQTWVAASKFTTVVKDGKEVKPQQVHKGDDVKVSGFKVPEKLAKKHGAHDVDVAVSVAEAPAEPAPHKN